MKDITFRHATEDDIAELTSVSIEAFHSDIGFGADTLKGPPGYDSIEFHKEMLEDASFFYVALENQRIIGAFWFMRQRNDEAYLYRIFIDPKHQGHGIGMKSLSFLFESHPGIKTWTLKTPKWNRRTPKFYKNAGFRISKEDDGFRYFEK